jgi:hypothetical protein
MDSMKTKLFREEEKSFPEDAAEDAAVTRIRIQVMIQ